MKHCSLDLPQQYDNCQQNQELFVSFGHEMQWHAGVVGTLLWSKGTHSMFLPLSPTSCSAPGASSPTEPPAPFHKYKMGEGKWKDRRVNPPKWFERTTSMSSRQREDKDSCKSEAPVLTGLWQASEYIQHHRVLAKCCFGSDQENLHLRTRMCLILQLDLVSSPWWY